MSVIQKVALPSRVFTMSLMNNTKPNSPTIESLNHAQRERLTFIEFRLYFLGDAKRQDMIQRFGIAPAVATRDFSQYRKLFPHNINFNNKTKSYLITHKPQPISKISQA